MQTYTTQQIMGVRLRYTELPYPGFSLDEVVRRKRTTTMKLTRSENAWTLKGTAKSTDEWVRRLVQGTLNKLAPEKYTEMAAQLCNATLFSTDSTLRTTVQLIFNKALQEPGYSEMYARLCHELARFEVTSVNADSQPANGKLKSHFRDAIVHIAEAEFFTRVAPPETTTVAAADNDDAEDPRARYVRRKRANIKFIGELFMANVVSLTIMNQIIRSIMGAALEGNCPPSDDIEILTELFETIGKTLDQKPDMRKKMSEYFQHLDRLKVATSYPPRIRFKILDLIDLRRNRWEPRVIRAHAQAPTTLEEQEQQQQQQELARQQQLQQSGYRGTSSGYNPRSPNSPLGSSKRKQQNQYGLSAFQDVPSPSSSGGRGVESLSSWRNVVASTSTAGVGEAQPALATATATATSAGPSTTPGVGSSTPVRGVVHFAPRVHSMLQEWVTECSNDFIPQWMDEFRNCVTSFPTSMALCTAVAAEVVRTTCMTTRREAQKEASSFLTIGLNLTDDEVFGGFASALATAIEDGVFEDVPKFSERFVAMLSYVSGSEVPTDLYYDTAKLLFMVHSSLTETEEETVDTLMSTWSCLPLPEVEIDMPPPVITTIAESAGPNQYALACAIICSLIARGLISAETLAEWYAEPMSEVAEAVKALVHAATPVPQQSLVQEGS